MDWKPGVAFALRHNECNSAEAWGVSRLEAQTMIRVIAFRESLRIPLLVF